jgi:phage tail-like protein
LLDLLPAVYRRSEAIAPFLTAFEELLFRPEDVLEVDVPGASLDEQIDRIPSLLDPYGMDTSEAFLSWLSQWAAITLYREAPDRRRLIAEMIPLYRLRGTKPYVERVLQMYVSGAISVEEDELPGMVVGASARSEVGSGTRLGEDAFCFSVRIDFSPLPAGREERGRLVALARAVIDLAKPAYTHYRLSHNLAEEPMGMVISIRSTVGVDTLLHQAPARSPEHGRASGA